MFLRAIVVCLNKTVNKDAFSVRDAHFNRAFHG